MNTPTSKKTTWAFALGLGLLSFQALPAAPFVRAGVQYFSYSDSDYSAEAGGSVAAGLTLGPSGEHELSLEVAHAAWSWSRPGALAPGLGYSGEGHVTPILASYRYYIGAADARVRYYAGLSAGFVKPSGDAKFLGSGVNYGGSASDAAAAFGVTAGINGKLTEAVSWDLGYRYLQAQDMDVATRAGVGASTTDFSGPAGPDIRLPAPSAHVVALGLKIRF
jgi:opacity protein-like surface antigen